uniref:Uncharacterized protein n=1 Tax=Phlebotomus papatasi TaxID=29031 RepID=A0A1B0CZF5_PHLPP
MNGMIPSNDKALMSVTMNLTSTTFAQDHFNDSVEERSDEEVGDTTDQDEAYFEEGLKAWAIDHNETGASINQLLTLLRTHKCFKYLPRDNRTLLQSPQNVNITSMGSDGEFWYNGLGINLKRQFIHMKEDTQISLKIHVDGVQIYRSSKIDFWPILYMVEENPEFPPEVVDIYCGDKKPENSSQFLKQFIDELRDLMENGLIVNGFTLSIKVKCVICDSPARAFIKVIPPPKRRSPIIAAPPGSKTKADLIVMSIQWKDYHEI